MTSLSKLLIFISITTVSGSFAYVAYKQNEMSKRQRDLETSLLMQKDVGDQITRSMSQFATSKDIEKMLKENQVDADKIKKDMDSLGAKIDHVNLVIGSSVGYDWQNVDSTDSKPIPSEELPNPVSCETGSQKCFADTFGYFSNTKFIDLNEKFKELDVPIGKVGFSASKEKPWTVQVYSREYKLITTSTVNEDQRSINYNNLKIKIDGKEYDIPIVAETFQTLPEYKFRWFSPQLFIGLDSGFASDRSFLFGPSLSLALMNYGQYKYQPDFSILQLGVAFDADKKVNYISITPAAYNIGKHLPIISNTYLGASFNISPATGETALTAGIRVGL